MSNEPPQITRAQVQSAIAALGIDGSWVTEITLTSGQVTLTGLPPWLYGAKATYTYDITPEKP